MCVDCGRILRRYKVGHDIDFMLDHCAECNGVWFDKNEWAILKSRNLHDDVHFIFSSAWQHRIVEDEQKKAYKKRIETMLGEEDYSRVNAFKEWAATQSKRNTIMAYLADLDV